MSVITLTRAARRLAGCLAAASWAALAHAATPLPLEAFAHAPAAEAMTLSPSGNWIAVVVNREQDAVVAVRAAGAATAPPRAVFTADAGELRIAGLHWISDDRLVIQVHYASRRVGVDTTETRLVAVGRDGSNVLTLTEPIDFAGGLAQRQDQVVDWLPGDGHHILMQAALGRNDLSPVVVRVDTDSGRREIVFGKRPHVLHWLTDAAHRVRVGVRQEGTHVEVLVCDQDGENWRSAWSYELFAGDGVEPLGFGSDPNLLYVLGDEGGRRALFAVDLRDAALTRRRVLAHSTQSVSGPLLIDPVSGLAIGVRSNAGGELAASFFDPAAQRLAQAIDAALPNRANRLLGFSADGTRYLVYSSGNGAPGRYLLGERAGNSMQVLASQYPELPADELPRKLVATATARDGVPLRLRLLLPKNAGSAKLPAVVMPFGVPVGVDSQDFDPLAEFLVDRGYAVLQVRFRSAAGLVGDTLRGSAERRAPPAVDDVADAARWLIARGTADPARVCVVGGSYGGYAALMGAARAPELYRCVVSVAGISDLVEMGRRQRRYINQEAVFDRTVGAIVGDKSSLADESPRNLAAQIRVPVLLVHGTADRVVPLEQSQWMYQALAKAATPARLVLVQDGDHDLGSTRDRLVFYRELETFLANANGVAGAPAATR